MHDPEKQYVKSTLLPRKIHVQSCIPSGNNVDFTYCFWGYYAIYKNMLFYEPLMINNTDALYILTQNQLTM